MLTIISVKCTPGPSFQKNENLHPHKNVYIIIQSHLIAVTKWGKKPEWLSTGKWVKKK